MQTLRPTLPTLLSPSRGAGKRTTDVAISTQLPQVQAEQRLLPHGEASCCTFTPMHDGGRPARPASIRRGWRRASLFLSARLCMQSESWAMPWPVSRSAQPPPASKVRGDRGSAVRDDLASSWVGSWGLGPAWRACKRRLAGRRGCGFWGISCAVACEGGGGAARQHQAGTTAHAARRTPRTASDAGGRRDAGKGARPGCPRC